MTAKTDPKPTARPTVRPPLPEAHADVALADITDICALVRMSASWVHNERAAGRFPAPVIREPRCTRWKIADIRAWLIERATQSAADTKTTELVTARAKKASTAAQAKRAAAIAVGQ